MKIADSLIQNKKQTILRKILPILICLFVLCGNSKAQIIEDSVRIVADTLQAYPPLDAQLIDSTIIAPTHVSPLTTAVDTLSVEVKGSAEFKPNPTRTLWMGALIPGFGQIANHKYWKLPIVYGGFMGFAYAISWNNSRYTAYKNGYIDISDGDPNTNYHLKLLPRGYTIDQFPGGEATFKNRLKTGLDRFRQYRDLSIILTAGYYALVLLDAYVDAQLYDFDIKPDLVLNVAPAQIKLNENIRPGYGLQCSIRF